MEAKKFFEEKVLGYKDALTKIGFTVDTEFGYKDENDSSCEPEVAKYLSARISIYADDRAIFEKEYYLPTDSDEICHSDFAEIDELINVANVSDNARDAIISYVKRKEEKASAELDELEDELDKKSKKLIMICAMVLGVTILAAIVLPFIL